MNVNQGNNRNRRGKELKGQLMELLVILLLVVPVICCAVMMYKVYQLEGKVKTLTKFYEEYEEESKEEDNSSAEPPSVIYAAEVGKDEPDSEAVMAKPAQLTPEELLEQSTEKKKVYLTFDDGPSQYTNELLDVLKEYNVKATFFVIAKTDKDSLKIYKRILKEGHTLGMHSYTHKYNVVYKNLDNFKKDIKKLSDFLYDATGERPKYYRFPGGSSNSVSKVSIKKCISYLNKEGLTYFDWNATNGDATGKKYTSKQMVSNVMKDVAKSNNSIVLMHDTAAKDTTIKSIPSLIKKLRKEGYVLLPISEYTSPVQHIKADSVK